MGYKATIVEDAFGVGWSLDYEGDFVFSRDNESFKYSSTTFRMMNQNIPSRNGWFLQN
eukprot:c28615_g1_i1 orf=2-172(-)